ncbi:MAG: Ig-like domain-containing protein, partial [Candidatus Ranarchaeia archaeon]
NGTLDDHSGNVAPEIWIARLDPRPITGKNAVTLLQDYFDRLHAYKNGSLSRPHGALLYVDDDWSSSTYSISNNMNYAYINLTSISSGSLTTATDYRARYTHNYEWIALYVHSFAYEHWFGPGGYGGEGKVNSTHIRNDNNNALFYLLFACHAAHFLSNNCLAAEYIFDSALATIGSTKTGGIQFEYWIHRNLGRNYTFGEAFRNWTYNIGTNYEYAFSGTYEGFGEAWYYGMVLFGDPLLTIHYDVTAPSVNIVSPSPGSNFTSTTITVNWTATDNIAIDNYYVYLNGTLNYSGLSNTRTFNLSSGFWKVKVVAKDPSGNIGFAITTFSIANETSREGPTIGEIIGSTIAFISTPTGMVLTGGLAAIIILAVFLKKKRNRS